MRSLLFLPLARLSGAVPAVRHAGRKRRSVDRPTSRYGSADHLQLGRPNAGARNPQSELQAGVNPLQFSWANTLIDPTSVELRFLTAADELDVLDTTFPHDKPQMLYWNVQSEIDGEATIEITYFTSGISWSADYVWHLPTPTKQRWHLRVFVRVTNNSGEEYEDAQFGWSSARSTWSRRSPSWRRFRSPRSSIWKKDRRSQLRFKAVRSLALSAGAMARCRSGR